jgi:hypothetical protein
MNHPRNTIEDRENGMLDDHAGMATAIKDGTYYGALELTNAVLELASSGEFLDAAKTAEILAGYLRSTHLELNVL